MTGTNTVIERFADTRTRVDRLVAEMKTRRTRVSVHYECFSITVYKSHSVCTTIVTMCADEKTHGARAYARGGGGGGDTAERNNIVIGQVVYDSSFKRL